MDELSDEEKVELLSMFNKDDYEGSLLSSIMGMKYLEYYPNDYGFKIRLFNKIKDNHYSTKIRKTLNIKKKRRY